MPKAAVSTLSLLICSVLLISLAFSSPAQSAAQNPGKIKELNFVFLHGFSGTSCSLQLLEDSIMEQVPAYIRAYEQDHPDTVVNVDTLNRCYPNDVDIDTWAKNIADTIEKHFPGKKNLVLIGHSMGGKTALYAVANDIGKLADKVAMVVTINSPIKSLQNYYFVGGQPSSNYWELSWLISNRGAINSLMNYDSSRDGQLASTNKRWLAFVSAESAPLSSQFDAGGVDYLPRDIDDSIVPISAQYADGADVVYYGEYAHSDFGESGVVADFVADQVLRYIFGGIIQCSVLARSGTLEHKADLFPGTDRWNDLVGGLLASSGTLRHDNNSFWWQEWDDVLGESASGGTRSNYEPHEADSPLSLTSVTQSGWANPDNPEDSRIRLRTRAAPGGTVQVNWSIYQQGLLPQGIQRDHYEVEIVTGTPLADIPRVSWETDNPRDLRLRIWSQADSPFRWFTAQWRVYSKENRQRNVIDELPAVALSGP
ncbi:MAG: alpha/beta hydrolase [Chloroflexota bacterium]